MKVVLETTYIGAGPLLFHVTVNNQYADGPGAMWLVAAHSMATALYTAWTQTFDEETPLDLTRCDGYLIGKLEK